MQRLVWLLFVALRMQLDAPAPRRAERDEPTSEAFTQRAHHLCRPSWKTGELIALSRWWKLSITHVNVPAVSSAYLPVGQLCQLAGAATGAGAAVAGAAGLSPDSGAAGVVPGAGSDMPRSPALDAGFAGEGVKLRRFSQAVADLKR